MCKKVFSIVCLICTVFLGNMYAQGYGILADAICWNDGADSSIVRLVLASSSANQPGFVRYVDQSGAAVDVSSGGSFTYGYCCCNGGGGGGGNVTRAFQVEDLRGLLVQTVGSVDSVGIDIFPLPINLTPTEESAYVIVWDSITNENVRVPMSAFPGGGSTYTVDNGLTENPANNFQLGGTLIQNTLVFNDGYVFTMGDNSGTDQSFIRQNATISEVALATLDANSQSTGLMSVPTAISLQADSINKITILDVQADNLLATVGLNSVAHSVFRMNLDSILLQFNNLSANPLSQISLNQDQITIGANDVPLATILKGLEITNTYIKAIGVPNYANDAAADADGTLPSGGVYTVTAEDRSLRIKP